MPTHPGIAEVACSACPTHSWGEVGIAVCVGRESAGAVSGADIGAAFLSPKSLALQNAELVLLHQDALPKSGAARCRSGWSVMSWKAARRLDLTSNKPTS